MFTDSSLLFIRKKFMNVRKKVCLVKLNTLQIKLFKVILVKITKI